MRTKDEPTCWALPGLTALLATTILSMFDAAFVTRGDTFEKTVKFSAKGRRKNLVPVEEGSEDEDDGRKGEPGGLTNVAPAQGGFQL